MTAAGLALIAGGLATLIGFRHLLWGGGGRRRSRPQRAIEPARRMALGATPHVPEARSGEPVAGEPAEVPVLTGELRTAGSVGRGAKRRGATGKQRRAADAGDGPGDVRSAGERPDDPAPDDEPAGARSADPARDADDPRYADEGPQVEVEAGPQDEAQVEAEPLDAPVRPRGRRAGRRRASAAPVPEPRAGRRFDDAEPVEPVGREWGDDPEPVGREWDDDREPVGREWAGGPEPVRREQGGLARIGLADDEELLDDQDLSGVEDLAGAENPSGDQDPPGDDELSGDVPASLDETAPDEADADAGDDDVVEVAHPVTDEDGPQAAAVPEWPPAGPARSRPERYGDRVDGWVRPRYQDDDIDLSISGEYWTPAPRGGYDDGSGYGWPVPVERLAAVPPEPGLDPQLDLELAAPTAVVPQWPPAQPSGRIELPRSWAARDRKDGEPDDAGERPPAMARRPSRSERRRASTDATELLPSVDDAEGAPRPERRPRPRPRPSQPERSTVYRSRHAAD